MGARMRRFLSSYGTAWARSLERLRGKTISPTTSGAQGGFAQATLTIWVARAHITSILRRILRMQQSDPPENLYMDHSVGDLPTAGVSNERAVG